MADGTKIEWCDATFNPWVGCTKVSAACDSCYAETWAKRSGHPELWAGERRRTSTANWRQPIKWNSRQEALGCRMRVFCASLADVFDNQVPDAWRRDLWNLIEETPFLTWMLLTKRPQNIYEMLPFGWGLGFPNVMLGVTCEDQHAAEQRLPHLLKVKSRATFISYEPALGPLHLWGFDEGNLVGPGVVESGGHDHRDADAPPEGYDDSYPGIDLVIAGCESGPRARPSDSGWFVDVATQCDQADVSFFMKQMVVNGRLTKDLSAFPASLRTRQFPLEMI